MTQIAYRVWLEDTHAPNGGVWWYCYLGVDGCLHDWVYTDEHADSLEWYEKNGYKVEKL